MTARAWQTADWRKKRAEIISRTAVCEWCGVKFEKGKCPPVVHHTVDPRVDADTSWRKAVLAEMNRLAQAKLGDPKVKTVSAETLKSVLGENVDRLEKVKADAEARAHERYCRLNNDEVAIICKKCHYIYETYRVKPGDPGHVCAKCGGFKRRTQEDLCFKCFLGTEGGREWRRKNPWLKKT
jgi:hypothetical protein